MDKLSARLNEQFVRLHRQSLTLIQTVPPDKLYFQPGESREGFPVYSFGEHVLRSAGTVERTFGGITTNLWDDPFEWTLPETLSTRDHIVSYLHEVEATRRRGFELFRSDDDLIKEIVVPSGEMQMIFALLLDTLIKAAHHLGCAFATLRLVSDTKIPML